MPQRKRIPPTKPPRRLAEPDDLTQILRSALQIDDRAEFLKSARSIWRKVHPQNHRKRGRPSLAVEVIVIVALAMQRMTGTLTQAGIMRATRDLYKKLREVCHDDPECIAPSQNVLRQYVKSYLLYRRYGPSAFARFPKKFPPHLRRGFEALPAGIHVDAILGFAGNVPKGPTMIGPRATRAADVTRRIRAIPTLPQ
jgi:hypothetical protein